jgi:pimeloyl-ACP methyl ester carboxylesterase
MKKVFVILAIVVSSAAILLGMDLKQFAFKYVDVNGHRLRMLISGQGNPTVVFETGGTGAKGGPLEAWDRVQPAVSRFTRTVSYDRAGIGWSAPGPEPRDARQIARDLHTALVNAQVAPPYILVGHSLGGPYIRTFAGMYPGEVGGMVLIDPTQEEFIEWNAARDPNRTERHDDEWKEIQASLAEAHESAVPPGIPVVLITAMGPRVLPSFATEQQKKDFRELRPMWSKFHDEWVAKLPNGKHLITQDSGHMVPFEQPQLIVDEIRKMVSQSRAR